MKASLNLANLQSPSRSCLERKMTVICSISVPVFTYHVNVCIVFRSVDISAITQIN